MENLRVAMIPVDQAMARKKRWNQMRLDDLVAARQKGQGCRAARRSADADDAGTGGRRQVVLRGPVLGSGSGWGARIRTWEWRNQNPLPYHLATPQQVPIYGGTAAGPYRPGRSGSIISPILRWGACSPPMPPL